MIRKTIANFVVCELLRQSEVCQEDHYLSARFWCVFET